ncbi:MAG TPA: transglycosylase SLT domain-containing protein, partial [Gammaproteobacteria bacterium]|nr:transglycosylase SLT domain-containing protein [Gammaproteobacteria bacterium]
ELQCFELQARMKTGNRIYLLEDIRSVWLSGKSLPQQCDPAFALLYKSNLMTNELVWDRIRLAMDRGNTGLTNYLSKRLDGYYRTLAAQWVAMHHNPDSLTRKATLDDTAPGREILVYGIKRLARININRAINNWETLQEQYQFSTREISDTNNHLAVRAARQNHPRSKELLDNIDNFLVNDDVFHWRLRTALEDLDWNMLRKWTTGVAPIEDIRLRWIYWQARALEQTGDFELARKAYASIAGKRDYYGFLAADRLGIPYNLNHKPLPDNPEAKQKVAAMPGMQRAKELRALDKNFQARREWHHALNLMTGYEKEIAATLAVDWGWHDRAIFAVSAAHSYDDLVLRFPIPFRDIIDTQVEKNSLDAGWVYALIRSESAFMEKVKSPAGAIGLMQVMPTTGKLTARKIGIKGFRTSDLEKAGKNVPIGSAYLREMLEKFNGNRVLATAAYNAGPNRVKRWLPKSGCMEPDIWIEKIPFNETWKYVRRVMFYASIYDWRLQESIKSLNQRMASIDAPPQLKLAALSCTGQQVSYN